MISKIDLKKALENQGRKYTKELKDVIDTAVVQIAEAVSKTLEDYPTKVEINEQFDGVNRRLDKVENRLEKVYPSYAGLQPEGLSKQIRWVYTEKRQFFSMDTEKTNCKLEFF